MKRRFLIALWVIASSLFVAFLMKTDPNENRHRASEVRRVEHSGLGRVAQAPAFQADYASSILAARSKFPAVCVLAVHTTRESLVAICAKQDVDRGTALYS